MFDDVGQHRIDAGFDLAQGDARLRHAVDAELGVIERCARIGGAGIERDALVDDQRAVEPAIGARAEHIGQHIERFAFAGLGRGVRRHQIVARDARLLDAGIGERDGARRFLHRLHGMLARIVFGARRDFAVGRLGVGLDLFGGDVAGDDHHRIVRRIEAPVERQRIVAAELLDLVAPADRRPAVGMIEIERRIHLLAEPAHRIVGDPHVLLFEHDIEFRFHHLVGEHEAGDAVGFERHHLLEVLARHALEEAGIVAGGEGILLAADLGDVLRERVAGILLGALEHQMFEEVRQAGLARRLVGGADLVPDHVGDDRRAMIGDHNDFKTVIELEIGDRRRCLRTRDASKRAGERHDEHRQF